MKSCCRGHIVLRFAYLHPSAKATISSEVTMDWTDLIVQMYQSEELGYTIKRQGHKLYKETKEPENNLQ